LKNFKDAAFFFLHLWTALAW